MNAKWTFDQARRMTRRSIDSHIQALDGYGSDIADKLDLNSYVGGMLRIASLAGLIDKAELAAYNVRRDRAFCPPISEPSCANVEESVGALSRVISLPFRKRRTEGS